MDLSYPASFKKKVAKLGFKLGSFWFYSLAFEAGWLPSLGFSCSLSIIKLVFRHLFHLCLEWRVRDILTEQALGQVIWVRRMRI